MGRPKLALPLGGRSVLERVIDAVRQGGAEHVLVVIGPHVPELEPLAHSAGAAVLRLTEETADMRATVEHGLRHLEMQFHPNAEENWLLLPADHPTLAAAVVRELIETRAHNPKHSILIPTFAGKRGHPALIAWKHVAGIRTLPPGVGLNVFLRQHPEATCELPLAAAVLEDLDTPEDYARLVQRKEHEGM
jgi:molybdenum cofactor cytidylyltransferase